MTHSHFLQSFMKQNIITNVEPVIRKALNLTGRQVNKILSKELNFAYASNALVTNFT